MDATLIKPLADLISPLVNEGSKTLFRRDEKGSALISEAIFQKLAKVVSDADPAAVAKHVSARQDYLRLRKFNNLENVLSIVKLLADETPDEERRSVDEDWFNSWFTAVENVSDDMIQKLWAKAFANKTDGRKRNVSLRAIDSLRLMQQQEVINFVHIARILDKLGFLFLTSWQVSDAAISQDALDDLLDLSLVSKQQYYLNSIAIPGKPSHYSVYWKHSPDKVFADPFTSLSLTARGKDLLQTIPDDLQTDSPTKISLNIDDPYMSVKYINILASGFHEFYDVTLSTAPKQGRRAPPGGWERTHRWDAEKCIWKRLIDLPHTVDLRAVEILENGEVPDNFMEHRPISD